MSDGPRYRRITANEWHDPAFRALDDAARVVRLYVTAGPQTTSVGCFRLSTAVALEDLGGSAQDFERRLEAVCEAFAWRWDLLARVIWITNWFDTNPPTSPNVVQSWAKLMHNVPDCDVKNDAIASINKALKNLPSSFREPWIDLSKTFSRSEVRPQVQPETNQGSGSRDQRPEIRGAGASRRKGRIDDKPADARRGNGAANSRQVHIETLARQTVTSYPGMEFDLLVDHFKEFARNDGLGDVPRNEALSALHAVLAEPGIAVVGQRQDR